MSGDNTQASDAAIDAVAGAARAPEALSAAAELTDEERDRLIDMLASLVVKRGLAVPAVFALEMHKPLCFFGSQMLLLGSPILGSFLGFGRVLKFASLVEKRENVELLIRRIEDMQAMPSDGQAQ